MQRWVIFNTVMEIQKSRRWYSPHKQMLRLKSCKTLNEIHQGSNFNGLSGHQVQWVTAKHRCTVWKNKVQDCSETISPSLSHPASHGFNKDLTCAVEESIRGLTLQAFPHLSSTWRKTMKWRKWFSIKFGEKSCHKYPVFKNDFSKHITDLFNVERKVWGRSIVYVVCVLYLSVGNASNFDQK
jgi:hypothetical protein